MSHSRIRRCEILLEFMQAELKTDETKQSDIVQMLEEALIFDLYYRENCKSRPSWAVDAASFKKMTHRYCAKGKLSHVEPFHYRFPDKKQRSIDALPVREKEPVWVLFHYDDRDPLDNQAGIEYVEYEED